MDIATIQGETRKPLGHHGNKRLREQGLIPAVIYGHGQANELVQQVLVRRFGVFHLCRDFGQLVFRLA